MNLMRPGARIALPREYAERAAYLVSGAAEADGRAGRMKLPDLDNAEFVPLPPDPLRTPATPF
jgi:hypothetical protein